MNFSIENKFKATNDGKCSISKRGMIATQSKEATEAGCRILESGGNAIDAAIAAAWTLGVTEPQASGLGGQTMMVLSSGEKIIAIDGSSRAPSLAHPNSVYKQDRALGYRASTVPSTPATLEYVHECYGSLSRQQVMEPAIHYAKEGYPITPLQEKLLIREKSKFEQVDSQSGLYYFYNNSSPYKSGEKFKQPDLANTLQRLAEKGIQDFYRGTIAKKIDADMRENGGLIHLDDLAMIPYPIEREPLNKRINGFEIYTMPPPGSGRSLLFLLTMMDLLPDEMKHQDEVTQYMLFIKLLRKTLLERSDRPYDPNFFPQIADNADMLDEKYAQEILDVTLRDMNIIPFLPADDEVSGETTHLSVIDENGLAVSLTQSIERVYGSKAAASGLGFLYNNYLFDFDYQLPEHPFYLRPNAVPWATVAPTLVFKDESVFMALGSPGSERIISTLGLFLHKTLIEGFSIDQSMEAPRLHCSLGGRVSLEANRFPDSLISKLKDEGYRIDPREDFAFYLGCVQAILKCRNQDKFQGVADIRRDGHAKGID